MISWVLFYLGMKFSLFFSKLYQKGYNKASTNI
jgi:hypothetical protein